MITVNRDITIPAVELELKFARSSGPGGQHVNKANTKVTLVWNVKNSKSLPNTVRNRFIKLHGNKINQQGEVILQSDGSRDQKRNIQTCYEKLQSMILEALKKPKKRIGTKPTKGSIERRLREKKQKAEKKQGRQKPKNWTT